MAFFDKIGKTVTETGQKTIAKTKEFTDIAKLNSMIEEEKKEIGNLYFQIGRLYFSMHASDSDEEFAGMVNSVKEAQSRIDDYKKQIMDIKGVRCCENCGKEIVKEAAFCSFCGVPVKITAPEKPDCIACSNCGEQNQKDAIFCIRCGAKIVHRANEEVIEPEPQEEKPVQPEKAEEQMKVCRVCKNKMPLELLFCTECGTKFEEECEAEIVKRCPGCGEELVEEAVFCTECGHRL